jgi:hypothetical protein
MENSSHLKTSDLILSHIYCLIKLNQGPLKNQAYFWKRKGNVRGVVPVFSLIVNKSRLDDVAYDGL